MEPNAQLLAQPDITRIVLAGREWPIPEFNIRTGKAVLPFVVKVLDQLAKTDSNNVTNIVNSLDDITVILFHSLRAGHPELTLGELESMPFNLTELSTALSQVVRHIDFLPQGTNVPEPKPRAKK